MISFEFTAEQEDFRRVQALAYGDVNAASAPVLVGLVAAQLAADHRSRCGLHRAGIDAVAEVRERLHAAFP
jgi:hypothetical protein